MTEAPTDTPRRPAQRVLAAITAEPWAITEAGLELVLSVAARENDISPEALEAYRAQHVPDAERLMRRGPVAILDVRGPLFRRANLFTAISGATSYDTLRRDFQKALDATDIRAIVLSFDTPGGEVTGVDELAGAIRAARGRKPIIAYVGGAAASAGYWLAAQASQIVIAETAVLGSIGVRAVLTDTSEADRKAGRLEFISSQSPGKRTDLSSDEGRARIQRMVDALAAVFVSAVAKGRGVSEATVLSRFGGGDVLIGAAAVRAGLADRLGNFEAVIAELAEGRSPTPQLRRSGMHISDEARAERARIKAILTDPAAKGREPTAMHLAFESDMDASAVVALLATLPAAAPAVDAQAKATADLLARLGPRAKDAPGGLVMMDPTDALPRASGTDAAAKSLWERVNKQLDAGAPKGAVTSNSRVAA